MNAHPFHHLATTTLILALCATCPATLEPSITPAVVAAVEDGSDRQTASDIIGRGLRSIVGTELGEIKDLVVNTTTGKVVYALVAPGEVPGIGRALRPVPFAAITSTRAIDGAINVHLNGAVWTSAPVVGEDGIAGLTFDQRGQSIYSYYGREWDDLRATRGSDVANLGSYPLVRVSQILGRRIQHANRTVGQIEDVVIDEQSRRASVLLDPNEDYVGSGDKFLIRFSQVSRAPDARTLTTALTPDQFAQAQSADDADEAESYYYP